MKSITIEGNKLVVQLDDWNVKLPAGPNPVARLPHVARTYLEGSELSAFDALTAAFGGSAGVIVRKRENVSE